MYDAIEEWTTEEGYRLKVRVEIDPMDPRDWDNLGTMACWHGRYELGDVQPDERPAEYVEALPEGTVILPLYLYDHSGITMNTTGFSCRWDSGQVGIIYATPEDIASCGAGTTTEDIERYLTGEVETYDNYLTGSVYGYVVEKSSVCDKGETHWDHVDSCWGYYGDDGIEQIKSEWPERKKVKV